MCCHKNRKKRIMPQIETTHGILWYANHRQPDATTPPLLLIHGAGASHLDYPAQLRRLNSIAPDLPGHGKSAGSGRRTISDYAADMVALLDALHIEKAIVAGHSMGGAIALTMALDFPMRVQGLVLFATAAKLPVSEAILKGIQTDYRAALQLIVKWSWAKSVPPELHEHRVNYLLQTPAAITYADFVACSTFDVTARLPEIAQPTLIIAGTADKMALPDWTQSLAAAIPTSELQLIEGAGHMVTLEQPDVVAELVGAWLANME
jgi:pimeloyl-ACP methyl ester carboxylesterase